MWMICNESWQLKFNEPKTSFPSFRITISMELCGPNMSECGGSLCQVKQPPCHSVPLCRLQARRHHMHNHPQLTHQPWVNHTAPSVASSPAASIRHRANRAMMAGCSDRECAAPRLGEEAALAQGVSKGKVLVTGGGGYFGSRLGRELASQGMSVILMDINEPLCDIPDGAVFCQVMESGEQSDSAKRLVEYFFKSCYYTDSYFYMSNFPSISPNTNNKGSTEHTTPGHNGHSNSCCCYYF